MAKSVKERPLTDRQMQALQLAEDTLFGDRKLIPGFGRQLRGLKSRGLVDGEMPHVYVTDAGRALA